MYLAEQITAPVAFHGEGPFWDSRNNRLLCMDVFAGTVVALDATGGLRRYPVPSGVATTIRRRTTSGYIIATERGLTISNDELTVFEHFAQVVSDPAVRTNDGSCDPLGNFVIGTMSYNESPNCGAVYRVTPDRRVTEILAPVSISNGVQYSADGTHVYYVDTPTGCIDVFKVHPRTGAWSDRRTHIRVQDTAGVPDGMAIDEAGGLWIALWGGGAVNYYDNTGRLIEEIAVPGVSQVSSCTFGGSGRNLLFITTSRKGLHLDHESAAGALFMVETAERGVVPSAFAG